MLIDTHAHLNFSDFETDLEKVIQDSLENGVEKVICVGSNLADSKKAVEIAKKYPKIVYAAVGIHPQKTDPDNNQTVEEQIKDLRQLALKPEVIAIGECGLDYAPAPSGEKDRSKADQHLFFEQQIKLSLELNLPIIIHSRKAFSDTISILEKYCKTSNKINGVFHCYAGGKAGIKLVEKIGFYFGVDGNITYDEGLQNVVKLIPPDKLVLETDSPFLTPYPYRGLRNEPKNAKIILSFLSFLLKLDNLELQRMVDTNVKKVFRKI